LTDPAKLPREVISELFEASQVSKVTTQKQPDFEFKDKTTVTGGEVLAYTKAVVNECCMLTFGEEKARMSKLISKLHRYMVTGLTTYAQRCCLVVPEIAVLTEAAAVEGKELLPAGQVMCQWFDFEGHNSSLFYIIGPLDEEAVKPADEIPADGEEELTDEQRKKVAADKYENRLVHFGKAEIDPLALSQLY